MQASGFKFRIVVEGLESRIREIGQQPRAATKS